jgi:hypothetical protein
MLKIARKREARLRISDFDSEIMFRLEGSVQGQYTIYIIFTILHRSYQQSVSGGKVKYPG